MTFREWLVTKRACQPALDWVGERTAEEAWAECTDGEWMDWIFRAINPPKRFSVEIAIKAARSIQHLNTDPRVAAAIDTAQAWLDGHVSEEDCRKAAKASYYAAITADAADVAYYVALTAYATAYAAYDAAHVTVFTADVAYYVSRAAYADTYHTTRAEIWRAHIAPEQFAQLVRESQ